MSFGQSAKLVNQHHSGSPHEKEPAIAVAAITFCLLILWLMVFVKVGD
jgi:hypothetical protein